jgi:hypothetical protein
MPDYPTLAAVDLGSGGFGSDITWGKPMLVCTERIFARAQRGSHA